MKNILALLLSLAVVVLCAYLPDIVSWRQDKKYLEQVQFASVADIQLEFTNAERTLKETIAILGDNRDSLDIPAELAMLKEENVQRVAGKVLQEYRDAGLLTADGDFYMQEVVPRLVYGTGENRNNVFWHISYVDFTHSYCANFTVDDRTGSVVCVDVVRMDAQEYTQKDMEFILSSFSEIYLESLGEEFREYDAAALLENAKRPNDGSYLANSIYYFVEGYRENSITFFVNKTGFYTYIA